MKQDPKHAYEIVWRSWDLLEQVPFGYVPLNTAALGFLAYVEATGGDEWSLIAAAKAHAARNAKA
jgi:hypothetical protein